MNARLCLPGRETWRDLTCGWTRAILGYREWKTQWCELKGISVLSLAEVARISVILE